VQPLAADFRPDAGGRKLALLKLVAAVKGVELDRLVQRDAQRQVRRFAALATGAVAGIAVVAGLAVTAESARLRAAAMSGYMIADVGKVLESAGRSDEQAKITKEAMKNGPGGPAGLMLQANGFQKLGALDAQNGDLANARKEFEKAHRITRRLLRTGPDDPERIFAHAQSEYWIGFFNLRSGDTAAAKAKFEDYARLAQRLIRIDPRYDRWRHEVAYAELNLGMAAMRQAGNAAAAERHFKTSLDIVRSIAAKDPSNPGLQSELADKYAWLADSQRLQGDLEAALDSRMKQRAVLDRLFERDPRDVVVRADLLSNELALARIEADEGAAKAALQRLDQGLAAVTALQATNPANADTAKQARIFQLFRVRTLLDLAAREQRPASASALAETLGNCEAASPAVADPEIKDFCVALRSRALDMAGDTQAAAKLRTSLQRPNRGDAYSPRWGLSFADEMRPVRTTIVAGRN
jgi:tetratricopeptide (TPR) repeat protein